MKHKYTNEQKEFIKNNVKGITTNELTNLINKEFNLNLKVSQIRAYLNNYKLTNDVKTHFVKGQSSWNKNKTWDEYMSKESQKNSRKTTFKKGNVPMSKKDIGTEWQDKNGYLYIKVKDSGKRFGRDGMWQPYHHLVWMQYHGNIPPNHTVIFLDKDKTNFDINNLQLVSRSELLILNKSKMMSENKEVSRSVTLLAKVIDRSRKKNKCDNNK